MLSLKRVARSPTLLPQSCWCSNSAMIATITCGPPMYRDPSSSSQPLRPAAVALNPSPKNFPPHSSDSMPFMALTTERRHGPTILPLWTSSTKPKWYTRAQRLGGWEGCPAVTANLPRDAIRLSMGLFLCMSSAFFAIGSKSSSAVGTIQRPAASVFPISTVVEAQLVDARACPCIGGPVHRTSGC